ncbi:hypothetical protein DFH08DRAFT_117650 [Mycena albidolilacea]|uniref:Uncharacterized protein n=1 Tax=Mycena albidolilacea TaxID=1033008 RepID=A0AAD7A707_9AGAR|nr:hypothetical protein DFH08DRAFT_117650 [Mycena albidolilacea]
MGVPAPEPPEYSQQGWPLGEPELEKMIQDRWLRAGSCALSFSVRGYAPIQFGATAIRNTLLHFAPRLRSISLTLSSRFLSRLVDIGPFPALETLAVANHFDTADRLEFEILGAAPRLQKLIYRGFAGHSRLLFSCRELSVVACEGPLSPDEFFDVVLGAPSLENFTGCVREGEGAIARLDAVTHGRLQTLHLSYGSYLSFLRLLRLPALQNIHLATPFEADECPVLLSFLTRSSASLRRFSTSIHDIPLATDWFSTSMPYLTDIVLYNPRRVFLGDFFRKLDRAQDKEFLPHLQNLAFRDCIVDVDAPLLEALSSRCMADEGSFILRSFQVWPPNVVDNLLDESQTTALRTLVERGMKIYVGKDEL